MLAINGMPDHVHILFGFRPSQSLSDLMQDIKVALPSGSTKKDLLKESFHGRKDMALFHTVNLTCPM